MIENKKMNTNYNGVFSLPNKKYHAIRTNKGEVFYNAIRTRNNWNSLTGILFTFDQYVTDIQKEYVCPNCGREELLWDSAFTECNEYCISCDYCKELTFLQPKEEKDNGITKEEKFIKELDGADDFLRYWLSGNVIEIFFVDVMFSHYRVRYHRQTGITELYLGAKRVHNLPYMPEEKSIINLVYIAINDWLLSERETIGSYFENKID